MSLHDFSDRFPALCRRLLDLRRGGRLAHAYLLVGDDSDGLEAFARAWIATCVCQTPRADGEACGVCGACCVTSAADRPFFPEHQVQGAIVQFKLRKLAGAKFFYQGDKGFIVHFFLLFWCIPVLFLCPLN